MGILNAYNESTEIVLNELFGSGKKKRELEQKRKDAEQEEKRKQEEKNKKDLDSAIHELKAYISNNGFNRGCITTDIYGKGLAYCDTSQQDVDKFVKSLDDTKKFLSYMEEFMDDDDVKKVYNYFKNKTLVIICDAGWGDYLLYCKNDKYFYLWFHEDTPQADLSDKMNLFKLKSDGMRMLKNDKFYVQADKEIGEYRLSPRPNE